MARCAEPVWADHSSGRSHTDQRHRWELSLRRVARVEVLRIFTRVGFENVSSEDMNLHDEMTKIYSTSA